MYDTPESRQLAHARQLILELMPEAYRKVLETYRQVETRDQLASWRGATDKALLPLMAAEPESDPENLERSGDHRRRCPLCKRGTNSPFHHGFKMPAGMSMHLWGEMSARQCDVMRHVEEMIEDRIEEIRLEAMRAAQAPKRGRRR